MSYRSVTIDSSVISGGEHSISRDAFIDILKTNKSPALPEAREIIAIIDDYGIDRGIALGFFSVESKYGTQGIAVTTKNWGNLRWGWRQIGRTKHPFAMYGNWMVSVADWCKLIEVYREKYQLTTLKDVLLRYAPPQDKNNPHKYAESVVRLIGIWQKQYQ